MPPTSTTCFALDDTSVIDSLRHPQAAMIRSLLAPASAASRDSILIDDEDSILRALDAGITVRSIFFSDGATRSDSLRQRLPPTARHYTVARRTCKKLFGNDAKCSLDELPSSRPIAIVFGSEKTGCSRQLAHAATLRATIPTRAAVESLNVAAAAAITLYNRYRFNSDRLPKRRVRAAC